MEKIFDFPYKEIYNNLMQDIEKLIISSLNEVYFNTTLMLDKMSEKKLSMSKLCQLAEISGADYFCISMQINIVDDESLMRICDVLDMKFDDFVKDWRQML